MAATSGIVKRSSSRSAIRDKLTQNAPFGVLRRHGCHHLGKPVPVWQVKIMRQSRCHTCLDLSPPDMSVYREARRSHEAAPGRHVELRGYDARPEERLGRMGYTFWGCVGLVITLLARGAVVIDLGAAARRLRREDGRDAK
jgi:hypothetical protein